MIAVQRLSAAAALACTAFLFAWHAGAVTGAAEAEIEYLLLAIGNSECTFVRNGTPHSAQDAESHLRMKYQRGRRYAKTAEQFIDRLATGSSITRRPYLMRCDDSGEMHSSDWLYRQLARYREKRSLEAAP